MIIWQEETPGLWVAPGPEGQLEVHREGDGWRWHVTAAVATATGFVESNDAGYLRCIRRAEDVAEALERIP